MTIFYSNFTNTMTKINKNDIKRLIVLSSPSGGGKTTVSRHLLQNFPLLKFSISATTREKRKGEVHGKDYYYLGINEFKQLIGSKGLVEWEEIYGNYYGTLRSEIDNAIGSEKCLLFDIDVKGALSLKKSYPDDTLLIFVSPPDIKTAEERLRKRATENQEQIDKRVKRMKMEMGYKGKFDIVIVNNILEETLAQAEKVAIRHLPK